MCSRGLLSDQYISEEKFFVDCYKAVMGNARPGTQHSTKGYDRYRLYKLCSSGSWFELYADCVLSGYEEGASGCCADFYRSMQERLWGKSSSDGVSCLAEGPVLKLCVSVCFPCQGDFINQKLWGR